MEDAVLLLGLAVTFGAGWFLMGGLDTALDRMRRHNAAHNWRRRFGEDPRV